MYNWRMTRIVQPEQSLGRALSAAAPALACALLVACGSDRPAQQHATELAAFENAAQNDPDLADPLGRAMVEHARLEAPGWVKEGSLFRGTLTARGRQSFLVVLKYGHCYRFLGVGPGYADLDLVLYDDANVELQRDATQSGTPVLGSSAALCPPEGLALRLEVRARQGQGEFAVGLFHDL
jgi:hypothetical protein